MKSVYRMLRELGIDLKKFKNVKYLPRYFKELNRFKKIKKIDSIFPCLSDWSDKGGVTSGHYFHQDLYVAQKIFKEAPKNHLDIGSRIDGFVAHVASFRKIEVADIRPNKNLLENINFIKLDITNIPRKIKKYDSISCLHVLEHLGLGRYGDNLDIEGYKKGALNLQRLLRGDGKLYFSTPIGSKERTEFNAHRIFNISTILELFKNLTLISFSYVDDQGILHKNIPLKKIDTKKNYNLNFGCGIFEFRK